MKRILSLTLTLALCLSLAVPAFAQEIDSPFADVAPDHWAIAYIRQAYEDGVIVGTGDQKDPETNLPLYLPEDNLTTAQFSVIVVQAFHWRELQEALTEPWYARFQTVVEEAGLTEGVDVEDWEAPMTRYQMARMLYNIAAERGFDLPEQGALDQAADRIPDWDQVPEECRQAVAACYALELLTGVDEDGTFAGDRFLTRAQAAAVYCKANTDSPMERTLQRVERYARRDSFISTNFIRYPGPKGTAYVIFQGGTTHGASTDMAYVYEDGSVLDINALLPISARLGGVSSYLHPTEIQFDEAGEKLTFITPVDEGIPNEHPGPDDPSMWLEVRDWGPTLCTVDLASGTMESMIPLESGES